MNEESNPEEAIFAAALELNSRDARQEYLDRACAGDRALRESVESLLRAHAEAETSAAFMRDPGWSDPAGPWRDDSTPREKAGDWIDRYRLLEPVGAGSFGTVWMAEQREPVRRRVALKIIKAGMDSREIIQRFEAERQALALMNHPHIAKVFDGGTTTDGRPYFVMELVRGVPITTFGEQHRLTLTERLELFCQVCQAVQHAHQKGIVHRDLKPSNILVTLDEQRPQPKVIDFGIAKATTRPLTEAAWITGNHQYLGTPTYMSPEQAGGHAGVDSRSDVYSLGVLLYELLTGRTPFEMSALLQAGYEGVMRAIRENEPPKPSTRLRRMLAADLENAAQARRLEAPRLVHLVQGDLDWIVMKALEKEPTRRYDAASELASDLERYLTHKPVQARPPSVVYRLGKLARRHRGVAWAALVLVVGVISASIVSTMLTLRLFQDGHPIRGRDRSPPPALSGPEADLLRLEQRVDQAARLYGAEHPTTLGLQWELGRAYLAAQRPAEAEQAFRANLDGLRRTVGPTNRTRLSSGLSNLANSLITQNKLAEAEVALREYVEIQQEWRPNDWTTYKLVARLGGVLLGQKKHAEAERVLLQGYQGMVQCPTNVWPPRSFRQVYENDAAEKLAQLYADVGRPQRAEDWRKKVIAIGTNAAVATSP